MAARRLRALKDDDIADLLDFSEIEDVSDDENPSYKEPQEETFCSRSPSSRSNSPSSDEEDEPAQLPDRGRDRGRRPRSGRNHRGTRTRHGVRTRGGALRPVARPIGAAFWSRRPFDVPFPEMHEPSYLPSTIQDNSNLTKYVQEYIDDDLIDLIVEKTNQHSIATKGHSLKLSREECKVFLGITLLMACINFPHIRMYWNNKYAFPTITEAMRRDRFIQLRNSLKFVFDLDVTPEMRAADKLWKVRPLIKRVLQGCLAQKRQQKISVDEMIIPFTGACTMRQYCPGKPHPTGLKAFILANPNGLVCDMIFYQGKNTFPTASGLQLGESVVLKMCDSLVAGHIVYCDRFFTTIKLIDKLSKRGIKCAGTVMKNRIPKYVKDDMDSDICLKRRGRGSYDVFVRDDGGMAITKWFDNKSVILLSSIYAAEEVDECTRYDRNLKRFIQVQRPQVIREYNLNMGGVDLTDRLLAVCPARARTKKWTVRFYSHMIDLVIVNSWIKYKEDNKKLGKPAHQILKLREFKQEIAEKMILDNIYRDENEPEDQDNENLNKKRGRPGAVPLPPDAKRFHAANHLPDMGTKQNRCRNSGCSKKTTITCIYCNIPLCITPKRNCFVEFHTK
ncbi:piggyBac transposable element-derived protein 3-like [Vanessa cardui]|uniref:piggyBac transposable element-derived protein 3-like n=1 Tax=Vanessa cardui TaxID=171605 RepID=UPI001F12EB34|nr:piggyBac transposable element-derived protein 3-like [Vanessa cardui]